MDRRSLGQIETLAMLPKGNYSEDTLIYRIERTVIVLEKDNSGIRVGIFSVKVI